MYHVHNRSWYIKFFLSTRQGLVEMADSQAGTRAAVVKDPEAKSTSAKLKDGDIRVEKFVKNDREVGRKRKVTVELDDSYEEQQKVI